MAASVAAVSLFLVVSTPVRDVNHAAYKASFVPTEMVNYTGVYNNETVVENEVPEMTVSPVIDEPKPEPKPVVAEKTVVAEEKKYHPELILEAAIPYAGRLKTKDGKFHDLLRVCNAVKVECQSYAPSCFMRRNRYMAGQAQRVIAVYDGRERGGTLFTMRYAHTLGKEVRLIKV